MIRRYYQTSLFEIVPTLLGRTIRKPRRPIMNGVRSNAVALTNLSYQDPAILKYHSYLMLIQIIDFVHLT